MPAHTAPVSVLRSTPLLPWVRAILWFVAANALLGAVSLLVFPERTATLFFWTIQPAINARLFGALYLGGAVAVSWVAHRGLWEPGRVLVPILLAAGVLIMTTTILHADRFRAGFRFLYWVAIYVGAPILAALAAWAQGRHGATRDAESLVERRVRIVAVALGTILLFGGVVALAFPTPLVSAWPWKTTPLMTRIFASWFTAFGVGLAWFAVEREWTRLRLVPWLMVGAGGADVLVLAAHWGDVPIRGAAVALYAAHLVLFAALGAWMLVVQERRTRPSATARPARATPASGTVGTVGTVRTVGESGGA
jgi:hypothetical protein